jgi:nicotinamidase-related amidase
MPVDLPAMVAPDHTAVLTMELQRGVIGDTAALPVLAEAVAAANVVPNTARLVRAARAAGARVVHCTAEFRADRAGSVNNSPLLAAMAKRPGNIVVGSPAAQVVPELGPEPSDLFAPRSHGVSPFTGTGLDQLLRNLGVRTVVATGVSLNVALLGLAIEAVNLGYQVVVPTDAVTGIPREYAEAVLTNTMAMLATLVTVDDVIAAWAGPQQPSA